MQQEEKKMGLKINTRRERELWSENDKQVRNGEEEEGGGGGMLSSSTLEDEPVSPTGQYFNSSVLSISVLVVLESQVPIDDSPTMALLRDVFLPINPRFSSIMVVDKNGVKQWKKVEVNLQSHLNTPVFPSNLTKLQYTTIFNDYLTKIALEPLPQTRPLWEIHLIKYPTTNAAGHLIFKLHHALGDGFSLMGALLSCLQRADDPSLPLTFPTFPTVKLATPNERFFMRSGFFTGFVPRAVSAAYNTMCDFCWSVLKSSVVEDDKTPIRSGGDEVEFQAVSLGTIAFQLERVKQIKVELGVTINDVIAGVINYGTRLYMREISKESTKSHSTALVLMNTRNTGGYKSVAEMLNTDYKESSWGNQFAFLHASIPELIMSNNQEENDDPLKLVYEARKIIQRKRSSLAVYLTGQTLEIIRKCAGPETAAQFIHNTLKNSSMTISNMVGPVEQMALANHPVKGLYFMVVGVPQSLTITVLSYTNTLRIAVGAEKGHIDVNKFVSCIEKAFDIIFNAAIKSNI